MWGLLEQAASLPALRAALDRAVQRRGAPGPDGISVADFAARGDAALAELSQDLLGGSYRPRPARRVQIPKPGGGYRSLAIGCVRDRVAAHALSTTLAAALDDHIHPCAYAYRRGRSTRDALDAVEAALGAGREFVLRADIESFFDQIDTAALLGALGPMVAEPPLLDLLGRVLGAGLLAGGEIADPTSGTPQGLPLSPLLSNLYLAPFDRAVAEAGLRMVRYGDDLCLCTETRDAALGARRVVAEALAALRLRLNSHKVTVRHRGEGFTFLGFAFGPYGRRPGPQASRSLLRRIEALLGERPRDAGEEIDELLRGWLAYYGSLGGVELPEAVRARAEALELARAERAQFGRPARAEPVAPAAPPSERDEAPSRFELAARELTRCAEGPEAPSIHARLRAELQIDEAAWPAFAAALRRRDGAAAAEVLARLGRYGDAGLAAALGPASAPAPAAAAQRDRAGGAGAASGPGPAAPGDDVSDDPPHLATRLADAERLLELLGGAEHLFVRDRRGPTGIVRERVGEAPSAAHAMEHLRGAYRMGVYPLRANHSVRFGAIRIVGAGKLRRQAGPGALSDAVTAEARRVLAALRDQGLGPLPGVEPGRGYLLWLPLGEPLPAARIRALLLRILARTGAAPAGVTREVIPAQDVARPDKPGTPALWPLGIDPRSGARAWLLDYALRPAQDPLGVLRDLVPVPAAAVTRAWKALQGSEATLRPAPAAVPAGPKPEPGAHEAPTLAPGAREAPAPEAALPPFADLPRAREVYQGCNVLRHFVDQAMSGRGLATSERHFLTDVLGRLGDEGAPALEAVFRHLDDFRPGMGARLRLRMYPHPTSCARIRSKLPELTAQVGCDCRFRVPPGAYPTPVLHALGAAEVPGLGERVREAAARGGLARAAVAAMNEGRKELGQKAAALCARLSELRRQVRLLDRNVASVEAELDAVLDEAGDEALETPSGTLRRVREGGLRRFVIEV